MYLVSSIRAHECVNQNAETKKRARREVNLERGQAVYLCPSSIFLSVSLSLSLSLFWLRICDLDSQTNLCRNGGGGLLGEKGYLGFPLDTFKTRQGRLVTLLPLPIRLVVIALRGIYTAVWSMAVAGGADAVRMAQRDRGDLADLRAGRPIRLVWAALSLEGKVGRSSSNTTSYMGARRVGQTLLYVIYGRVEERGSWVRQLVRRDCRGGKAAACCVFHHGSIPGFRI